MDTTGSAGCLLTDYQYMRQEVHLEAVMYVDTVIRKMIESLLPNEYTVQV